MRTFLLPLGAGALFGAGLVVSGMADPAKVLAFLRLAPGWDPSLALVMASALAVSLPGFAWARRRGRPLLGGDFSAPATQSVDRRLLIGAALFGLGWGLAGFCPGPAVVAGGFGSGAAWLFLPSMLLGAWFAGRRQ